MNSVSAISLSDIPEILMAIHPWWNHCLQYGVSQPIADSFSSPLNTVRHFAQNDVDPSNVYVVLQPCSQMNLHVRLHQSLLAESEDDVLF